MATRYYLPASGTPGASPAMSAGFVNDAGLAAPPPTIRPMATAKSNTALATQSDQNLYDSIGDNDVGTYRWIEFVSGLIGVVNFNATTFSLVIRAASAGSANPVGKLRVSVRLLHQDGTLTTLLAATDFDTNIAFSAALATRIINATALANVTSSNNDRLVVEIGVDVSAVGTTAKTFTVSVGDPSATADFALTSGLTTSLDPWCEFSAAIPAPSTNAQTGNFFPFFH